MDVRGLVLRCYSNTRDLGLLPKVYETHLILSVRIGEVREDCYQIIECTSEKSVLAKMETR